MTNWIVIAVFALFVLSFAVTFGYEALQSIRATRGAERHLTILAIIGVLILLIYLSFRADRWMLNIDRSASISTLAIFPTIVSLTASIRNGCRESGSLPTG
jgi:hypothetical protein